MKVDEDIRIACNSNRNSYTTETHVIDMQRRLTRGQVLLKETREIVPLSMPRAECNRTRTESGNGNYHAQTNKENEVFMTSCGCKHIE